MTTEASEIAAKLTKAQREALTLLPTWGFPSGHNQWFDVEYASPSNPDDTACAGEDMDTLLRRGLAVAGDRDPAGGVHLVDGDRECEPRWPVDLSPLGLAVRDHLMAEQGQ